jgi:hypothetical protein
MVLSRPTGAQATLDAGARDQVLHYSIVPYIQHCFFTSGRMNAPAMQLTALSANLTVEPAAWEIYDFGRYRKLYKVVIERVLCTTPQREDTTFPNANVSRHHRARTGIISPAPLGIHDLSHESSTISPFHSPQAIDYLSSVRVFHPLAPSEMHRTWLVPLRETPTLRAHFVASGEIKGTDRSTKPNSLRDSVSGTTVFILVHSSNRT